MIPTCTPTYLMIRETTGIHSACRPGLDRMSGRLRDQEVEQALAVRVDPVQEQDENRDVEQITRTEDQGEGASSLLGRGGRTHRVRLGARPRLPPRLLLEGLPQGFSQVLELSGVHPELSGGRRRRRRAQSRLDERLGPQSLPPVDPVREKEAQDEQGAGEQHREVEAERGDHLAHDRRTGDGPGRPSDLDDGKQPLAFLVRVQVVRESPELRQDHRAEDPDPDEERDPDPDASRTGQEEDEAAGGEE